MGELHGQLHNHAPWHLDAPAAPIRVGVVATATVDVAWRVQSGTRWGLGPVCQLQLRISAVQGDPDYAEHIDELNKKFEQLHDKIQAEPNDLNKLKAQILPLARIKKIMKSDQDVRMISSEAPIVFALACQMFITEITHKAAYYARKHNRKTLQRNDIARVIADNE